MCHYREETAEWERIQRELRRASTGDESTTAEDEVTVTADDESTAADDGERVAPAGFAADERVEPTG